MVSVRFCVSLFQYSISSRGNTWIALPGVPMSNRILFEPWRATCFVCLMARPTPIPEQNHFPARAGMDGWRLVSFSVSQVFAPEATRRSSWQRGRKRRTIQGRRSKPIEIRVKPRDAPPRPSSFVVQCCLRNPREASTTEEEARVKGRVAL